MFVGYPTPGGDRNTNGSRNDRLHRRQQQMSLARTVRATTSPRMHQNAGHPQRPVPLPQAFPPHVSHGKPNVGSLPFPRYDEQGAPLSSACRQPPRIRTAYMLGWTDHHHIQRVEEGCRHRLPPLARLRHKNKTVQHDPGIGRRHHTERGKAHHRAPHPGL